MSSIVRAVKERNEEFEGGEEDSEIDGSAMFKSPEQKSICLLYTSDAADDL